MSPSELGEALADLAALVSETGDQGLVSVRAEILGQLLALAAYEPIPPVNVHPLPPPTPRS